MKNKNYIIIGASGGIGTQLSKDLHECQSNIILGYHNQSPQNDFSVIKSEKVDATSFESTLNFFTEATKEFDHIDGVVSLPGSILLKPPHLVSESDFYNTIDVNLKSAFSVVRAAGKLLSNSSIVLLSTAAVDIGLNSHELIVAAKAGIESIVKSASKTYARKKLRFNAVAPGLIDTPLSSRIINNPAALEISKKMQTSDRVGEPKDISNMIKFLLNPSNNWITGQTFRVDGGLSSTKS